MERPATSCNAMCCKTRSSTLAKKAESDPRQRARGDLYAFERQKKLHCVRRATGNRCQYPKRRTFQQQKQRQTPRGIRWNICRLGTHQKFATRQMKFANLRMTRHQYNFALLMDPCILKHSALAEHLQWEELCFAETVKDDTGCEVVFVEQGTSESQMTAAKLLDTLSRQPGMFREATDAVSANTQL